jgi:hypothetical protein
MHYQASDDPELGKWITHQTGNGTPYTRALAEAAKLASPSEYYSLQPVLRYLHAQSPEPDTTIRTLATDRYKVVFNETDEPHEFDGAFARFNSYIFGSSLPKTKIRYATSIQSLCEPGWPIGVLAMPDDAVTCRIPGQFQIGTPHVFITEKLRRVAPVNEWVLLHEICHFKVKSHGPEFVAEVKRALDLIDWRVLLGDY